MATPVLAAPPAQGTENQPPEDKFNYNLNIHLVCPDCQQNPPDLVEDSADTICANCGRVLAERLISYESEWRTFNSDEKGGDDPNRVGEAESDLLYGNSGTTIGGGGPNISKETRKLKKAQAMQNEDKNNRALQAAYSQIDAWADSDHVTKAVKDQAKSFYKDIYDSNNFRGKNTNALLASCLFIACRKQGIPRSFAEIMNLTRIPKKEIGRTFKQLNEFLQMTADKRVADIQEQGMIATDAQRYKSTVSSQPNVLVERFCGMLGIPFRIRVIATKLAEKIPGIPDLAGRSPLSTAGACMYFASHLLGRGKSLTEIHSVSNVSEATIKGAYKKLLARYKHLVDPDWLGPQQVSLKDQTREPLIGDVKNLPDFPPEKEILDQPAQ